ncbi:MAG TPA: hypothetical protein VGZ73_24400 [Bryobacteraceae bacterium]|jgi:hypothetical protein|nr:hypothetical protein [Bryobacteraceae bacterium]
MGWWDRVWKTQAEDWVYGWLRPEQVPAGAPSGTVEPDAAYLNIFLKSARIVNVRQGLKTFYGAVHSFTRLPHRSTDSAEFNVVTTPSELKNVDADGIDRVIQINHRLLGPVPYVDGDLEMEIGLFSVAASNLAAPYLSLLESLSKTAGVSFISAAVPLSGPILEGVKLLTGSDRDVRLEIGLSITEPKPRQGYCVAMRAPKDAVKLVDLKLDPEDFRLLGTDGRAIRDYPYIVIEVSSEPRRPDWFKIPELAKAYSRIQELYRNGSEDTEAALQIFRRTAVTCNDLILPDAKMLAEKVASMYQVAGAKGSSRGVGRPGVSRELPDFEEVNLYS